MEIKILGGGCAACKKLEKLTLKALKSLKIEAEIDKVTDYEVITSVYNIMTTPALVLNGDVVIKGRVPSYNEVVQSIEAANT